MENVKEENVDTQTTAGNDVQKTNEQEKTEKKGAKNDERLSRLRPDVREQRGVQVPHAARARQARVHALRQSVLEPRRL